MTKERKEIKRKVLKIRELKIMEILWKYERPLSAYEIALRLNDDPMNIDVAPVCEKLIKKAFVDFIEMPVGAKNIRFYVPTISEEEYTMLQIKLSYGIYRKKQNVIGLASLIQTGANIDSLLQEIDATGLEDKDDKWE